MNGTYQQGHIQILSRGGVSAKEGLVVPIWLNYETFSRGYTSKIKEGGIKRTFRQPPKSAPASQWPNGAGQQANNVTFMANISE